MSLFHKVKALFRPATIDMQFDKQVLNLLKGRSSVQALFELQNTIHALEKRDVLNQFFRPPFYYWKSRLNKETRQQLIGICREIFSEETELDTVSVVVKHGLLMRLMAPNADEVQSFVSTISAWENVADLDDKHLNDLIIILFGEARFDLLCKFAREALERDSTETRCRELYCDLYFQGVYFSIVPAITNNEYEPQHSDKLHEAFKFCEKHLGETSSHLLHYKAVIACVDKRFKEAVELLTNVKAKEGYFTQFFRAGLNVLSPDEMQKIATQDFMIPDHLHLKVRHQHSAGATLISCNDGYYHMYFKSMAESFAFHNSEGLLHVHAIDFDIDDAELDALEAALNIKINITLDKTGLESLSPDVRLGYCAGARYMYLPYYLDMYEKLIITDIDGVIKLPQDAVWQGREDHIILSTFIFDPDHKASFIFWSNIIADSTAFPATETGKKFGKVLSNYLQRRFQHCFETGERFFFSDQVGLLLTVLYMDDPTLFKPMPDLFEQLGANRTVSRGKYKREAQKKMLDQMRNQ